MDSSYGGTPPMGIQSIRKKSEQKHSRSFARPRQVCAARRFSSRGRGDSTASARSPRSPARSIGLEWPRPNNPGALHPPPNGQRRASWPITKLLLAQIADLADLEIQSGPYPYPPLSPFPSRPSPLALPLSPHREAQGEEEGEGGPRGAEEGEPSSPAHVELLCPPQSAELGPSWPGLLADPSCIASGSTPSSQPNSPSRARASLVCLLQRWLASPPCTALPQC
eukprot:scaffold184335_cov30-Tisochrysis_lutea.AAC.4